MRDPITRDALATFPRLMGRWLCLGLLVVAATLSAWPDPALGQEAGQAAGSEQAQADPSGKDAAGEQAAPAGEGPIKVGRSDPTLIRMQEKIEAFKEEIKQRPVTLAERVAFVPWVNEIAKYYGFLGMGSILLWSAVVGLGLAWCLRLNRLDVAVIAGLAAVAVLVLAFSVHIGIGMLAVVGWLLGLLPAYKKLPRHEFGGVALILSFVAVYAAHATFQDVGNIQEDRRLYQLEKLKQEREARERQIQQAQQGVAGRIRMAEDSALDRADAMGIEDREERERLEQAAKEGRDPDAWKKYIPAEQQKRDEGKSKGIAAKGELEEEAQQKEQSGGRLLPPKEFVAAKLIVQENLEIAQWVFWIGWVVLLGDYLLRFNLTFSPILPLPLACRALDETLPKDSKAVVLPDPEGRTIQWLLRRGIRKGETFVYFGHDPAAFAQEDHLPRLEAQRMRLWRVPKLILGPEPELTDAERAELHAYLLESVWFGRALAVVDPLHWRAGMDALIEFLELRRHTKASVGRTVYVAWDRPEAMPEDVADRLRVLLPGANFKLVARDTALSDEALAALRGSVESTMVCQDPIDPQQQTTRICRFGAPIVSRAYEALTFVSEPVHRLVLLPGWRGLLAGWRESIRLVERLQRTEVPVLAIAGQARAQVSQTIEGAKQAKPEKKAKKQTKPKRGRTARRGRQPVAVGSENVQASAADRTAETPAEAWTPLDEAPAPQQHPDATTVDALAAPAATGSAAPGADSSGPVQAKQARSESAQTDPSGAPLGLTALQSDRSTEVTDAPGSAPTSATSADEASTPQKRVVRKKVVRKRVARPADQSAPADQPGEAGVSADKTSADQASADKGSGSETITGEPPERAANVKADASAQQQPAAQASAPAGEATDGSSSTTRRVVKKKVVRKKVVRRNPEDNS